MTNIPIFNRESFASELRNTSKGPVAKIQGTWYSVNGNYKEIVDVRYRLTESELLQNNITND